MYLLGASIESNDICLISRFKWQYKIRTIEIVSESFGTDLYLLLQLSILHETVLDRIKCILQTWGSIVTEIQRAPDTYLEFIYVPRSSLENVVTDVFHEHSAWLDSVAWQLGNNTTVFTRRMTMHTITEIRLPFGNCRMQMQLLCINS